MRYADIDKKKLAFKFDNFMRSHDYVHIINIKKDVVYKKVMTDKKVYTVDIFYED
jgi:hypothetical protein